MCVIPCNQSIADQLNQKPYEIPFNVSTESGISKLTHRKARVEIERSFSYYIWTVRG